MNFGRWISHVTGIAWALAALGCGQATPTVEGAWARPAVAGQTATAVYLRVTSPQAARIESVQSAIAERAEIHTMEMDGDVMRMRQVDAVDLPAGQTVEFKPGGLHIMLMQPKAPLNAGDTFPLVLQLAGAQAVTAQVRVGPPPQ